MRTGRTGLIVWLHNTKYVKVLRKFGNIHYVSKKMAYAVLYCDSEKSDLIVQKLEKQKFTKRVDYSYLGQLKTEYASKKEFNKVEEELIY